VGVNPLAILSPFPVTKHDLTCTYYYSYTGWWFDFIFSIIYGIILPIDELIFFRGVAQPPTRKNIAVGIAVGARNLC
jgi:hypothetical protein